MPGCWRAQNLPAYGNAILKSTAHFSDESSAVYITSDSFTAVDVWYKRRLPQAEVRWAPKHCDPRLVSCTGEEPEDSLYTGAGSIVITTWGTDTEITIIEKKD